MNSNLKLPSPLHKVTILEAVFQFSRTSHGGIIGGVGGGLMGCQLVKRVTALSVNGSPRRAIPRLVNMLLFASHHGEGAPNILAAVNYVCEIFAQTSAQWVAL